MDAKPVPTQPHVPSVTQTQPNQTTFLSRAPKKPHHLVPVKYNKPYILGVVGTMAGPLGVVGKGLSDRSLAKAYFPTRYGTVIKVT